MALEFDGATQYVNIDDNLGITSEAISLTAWFKCNAEISDGYYVITSKTSLTDNMRYAIYYHYDLGTRKLKFYRTKIGVEDNIAEYTVTLGTSDWYFVALTYDETNVRGYVNGNLVAGPVASSGVGTLYGADSWSIAARNNNGLYGLFGDITVADARVYNRALTANEIAEIYHKRGADRVWEGLVGWWRLDKKTSGINSVIDLSGNGNHGTPYNSPVYQASPHRLRRGVLVS
jgi:hypothetical protein